MWGIKAYAELFIRENRILDAQQVLAGYTSCGSVYSLLTALMDNCYHDQAQQVSHLFNEFGKVPLFLYEKLIYSEQAMYMRFKDVEGIKGCLLKFQRLPENVHDLSIDPYMKSGKNQ